VTEEDFRDYVAAFNGNDLDGFGHFYAEDVIFELGGSKRIDGRENILAFYRQVKDHITEVVTPLDVVVTPTRIAMHCRTTFETFKDWPDFEIWPTMAGDCRTVETIALYQVDPERDCFTHIRGARFKP